MSVLAFGGFEYGSYADGWGAVLTGTESIAGARTGGRGARYFQNPTPGGQGPGNFPAFSVTQGNWLYFGAWYYVDIATFGGANVGQGGLFQLQDSTSSNNAVRIDVRPDTGQLNILGPGNNPNFTSTNPVPQQRWFYLAVAARINSGGASVDVEVRIDGVVITSYNSTAVAWGAKVLGAASIGITTIAFSNAGSPGNNVIRIDDWVFQDSTGSVRNSWPEASSTVTTLKPVADSARGTNWVAGAGGTTSLFDAVDNAPPVGLTTPTNTSQVKNAAKDTVGLYDASVEAYNVAVGSGGGGVAAPDIIDAVQPFSMFGSSAAAALSCGVVAASNPGPLTEVLGTTLAATVANYATDPSNWLGVRGAVAASPSVTRGTRPVVRIRKNTSATTALYSCAMGMNVLTTPTPKAHPIGGGGGGSKKTVDPDDISVIGQAMSRGALWMKRRSGISVPRLWTPETGGA
jgi:hypothetical protein